MYAVIYRKVGSDEWSLTTKLHVEPADAVDDAQARYERNRDFNRGRGYEYAVMQLVCAYTLTSDEDGDMVEDAQLSGLFMPNQQVSEEATRKG